jgi:hypothetical protein
MENDSPDPTPGWWTDYSNIITLTAWMADNDYPVSEVARAVEKPWSYGVEFLAAKHDADDLESFVAWMESADAETQFRLQEMLSQP